ncbi:hypothetical protein BK010_10445 (plasmid) [Tenericutes bacterium MO-XQ]|nr:hypothetical protein BK010_10445 [Tenericutes bacterium MO-XQ]
MWIKYTDSEVNKFHPICEIALNNALNIMNKNSDYRVAHHQYAGSLEMDFVIENRITKQILCVIEIKRTPNDVQSTRFQYQAMSYVQQLYYKLERPYYLITNLEYAFSFRYDSSMPQPYQQILSPGLIEIARFRDYVSQQEYIDILTDFFRDYLVNIFNNEYDYLLTLKDFSLLAELIKDNPTKWKTNIAVSLYEYIRGSFSSVSRNDLRDVRAFRNDISRICFEGHKVNFSQIFTYDKEYYDEQVIARGQLLIDLYRFASVNISGSMVSDILHTIVSSGNEHQGEVATDKELGKIVALLAKVAVRNFDTDSIICDPAAGSGNLLESAIQVFDLSPIQIFANDVNRQYSELLSLRFGLNFPKVISLCNSPRIETMNITGLQKSDFQKVKVVLLNPPYVAGINSVDRKQDLVASLMYNFDKDSKLNIGQAGLELVFLEYITNLVDTGTIISCIMPKQLLVSRGPESQAFRHFLINDFGLKIVFNYPGTGLFDSVTKDTFVLVGNIGVHSETVKFVSSLVEVSDLDADELFNSMNEDLSLTNKYKSIGIGLEALQMESGALSNLVEEGWRFANSELVDAIDFCEQNLFNFKGAFQLSDFLDDLVSYRGKIGNQGASDLLFFNSSSKYTDFYSLYSTLAEAGIPALRNSDSLDNVLISSGDSRFLDWGSDDSIDVSNAVITNYLKVPMISGRQAKKQKNVSDIVKIVKKSKNQITKKNSLIIPRDLRVKGRVFINLEDMYLSTNFVVIEVNDYRKAVIVGSWMTSVFYQLICEISAKDNEGTRKMEVADLKSTYIINPDLINHEVFLELESALTNTEFINLQTPQVRDVDIIWAKLIFGDSYEEKLEYANNLLGYVGTKRNS